jgi:hypothetical protein
VEPRCIVPCASELSLVTLGEPRGEHGLPPPPSAIKGSLLPTEKRPPREVGFPLLPGGDNSLTNTCQQRLLKEQQQMPDTCFSLGCPSLTLRPEVNFLMVL